MRSLSYHFTDIGKGEAFELYPLSDIHMGNVGCDKERLREDIEKIRVTPNAYSILGGDLTECINVSDKRFDERQIDPAYHHIYSNLATEQAKDLCKDLMPIKDKILGAVWGNHEEKIRKNYHQDIHGYICENLGISNLTAVALVNLHFQRKGSTEAVVVTIFIAHGHASGDMPGSLANNLDRLSNKFVADIYMVGHAHKMIGFVRDVILPVNKIHNRKINASKNGKLVMRFGEIAMKKRLFVGMGSYLGGYPETTNMSDIKASYVETKLLSPSTLGNNKVTIIPFKSSGEGVCKPDYFVSL